jgi:hypothetical protein
MSLWDYLYELPTCVHVQHCSQLVVLLQLHVQDNLHNILEGEIPKVILLLLPVIHLSGAATGPLLAELRRRYCLICIPTSLVFLDDGGFVSAHVYIIALLLASALRRMDWIPQLCTFNGQKKWTTMNFIWRVLRGKTSTISMSGGEWMSFLQQLVLVLQFDDKIITVEAHRIVRTHACCRSSSHYYHSFARYLLRMYAKQWCTFSDWAGISRSFGEHDLRFAICEVQASSAKQA